MTPRNPIDDLFQQRLEHYELDAPMHVWTDIAHRRDAAAILAARPKQRYSTLALLLLLVVGFSGLLLQDQSPATNFALGAFPIPRENTLQPSYTPARVSPPPPIPAVAESTPPIARSRIVAAALTPATPTPEPVSTADPAPLPVATDPAPPPAAVAPLRSLPAYAVAAPERGLRCVRFGEGGQWRLFADLTSGPTVGLRQLRARTDEFTDYADARRSTESPQISYTAGLRLSLVSDFNLALRSGLQFTQFNEKFDFLDSNGEKITITNIFGANGEIIGTDTLIEKSIRRDVAHNRYRMIDIPLLLGYELHRGKWTFAFNAGALVNLLFHARGSFLDPETLQPVAFSSISPNDAPPYRTEIGIGWYAGLGLHYQLQNGLQLLLEPHLRYNPLPVTHDSYGLEQRYLAGGLSIGLRKQI